MENISYKTLKFRRRFGIEIELNKSVPKATLVTAIKNCSNHQVQSVYHCRSVNNKTWHVKFDITCGDDEEDLDGGWEVASFVGHTPQDIIHMGSVATALKEVGGEVNEYCGLHIHAEAHDLLPCQVGVILAHWIKIEHVMKAMVAPYRRFEHCELLGDVLSYSNGSKFRSLYADPETLYEEFLPPKDDDDEDDDPNDYRYRAINIINYYLALKDKRRKRKTLELRLPESTLEENDVIGWCRLYLNFIERAKRASMPGDLYQCDLRQAMTYLGLHHDSPNFYLFGPSLNKTRIWVLNRIIKNSKREDLRIEAKKLLKEVTYG